MRILRCVDASGNVVWARETADGALAAFDRNPLDGGELTDRNVECVRRLAPVVPSNIFCIGLNYAQHAAEGKQPIPEHPVVFMKATSAMQHPGEPIVLPRALRSDRVDFECELAVVIGREAKNVPVSEALEFVFGYTVANDVSARDWQRQGGGGQWVRGKTFDTFCPVGPVLVTADEIPDPQALRLRTTVSGEVMQDWTTSDMIFSVAKLISFLSGSTTLLPGTLILTGTPHGVGFARTPPRFLAPGDVVTVEVEGIGSITNPVIEEPLPAGTSVVRLGPPK